MRYIHYEMSKWAENSYKRRDDHIRMAHLRVYPEFFLWQGHTYIAVVMAIAQSTFDMNNTHNPMKSISASVLLDLLHFVISDVWFEQAVGVRQMERLHRKCSNVLNIFAKN